MTRRCTDRRVANDAMPRTAKALFMESTEPALPIERIDPTEPIDAIEPALPIDAIEPTEPIDPIEPALPMERIEPVEPSDPSDDGERFALSVGLCIARWYRERH
jgi:hypothetical protein